MKIQVYSSVLWITIIDTTKMTIIKIVKLSEYNKCAKFGNSTSLFSVENN